MALLQRDLAAATTDTERIRAQLAQEQAAKAAAEAQLAAKTQEMATKDQQYREALQAAIQAAEDTARQVKAANDAAAQSKDAESAATVARLEIVYQDHLGDLRRQLVNAQDRAAFAETSAADRAELQARLDRVDAAIAARPVPAEPVVADPDPVPLPPIITGRNPPVGTPAPQGSNIRIQWDPRETRGPWILRIDYNGANPDFQEVTDPGPIVYTVKRQGALLGTIYSVTVV